MASESADPMDDYKLQSDADTLQKHAEITSDPERHAAAHAVLKQRVTDGKQAVKQSSKAMNSKVKKGLGKAFPSSGSTPFEKAGKNTESQGEQAE
jgi:hypothetical protein